jgi:uncharacterized protein (UPF0276 family)
MTLRTLGLGIGWRPELAWTIDRHAGGHAESGGPSLNFVEIVAEDFGADRSLPPLLQRLRDRGLSIIPHGVSLSLGSAEPPSHDRLDRLARLADRCQAPLVSEHVAFVRGGGRETGHLLPVPRTRETLDILVENIQRAKAALPVPLALENIATLMEWPGAELDAADFLCELLRRADVLLLLDLENVYANCRNHGGEPAAFLARLPLERIAYVHVAGGIERGGLFHDTHTCAVPPAVLELVTEVYSRTDVPGVMLERDGHFPPEPVLLAELSAIHAAAALGEDKRRALPHVPRACHVG